MSLASGVCTRGVVLMAALLAAFSPARANDAAHKMAEKFANEAKKSEETDAQRKAAADARKKETERLAQEKLREEARKRAEALLKAERDKHNPPPKAPVPVATDPAREEDDMLTRARVEEQQRKAAETAKGGEEEARRLIEEAERASRQLEELLTKTEPRLPDPAAVAAARRVHAQSLARMEAEKRALAEAQRARIEAEKFAAAETERARNAAIAAARRTHAQSSIRIDAEKRALAEAERARIEAEKLAAAEAERLRVEAERRAAAEAERTRITAASPPSPAPTAAPVPSLPTSAPSGDKATPPAKTTDVSAKRISGSVTVLVVMQPGNYGIRRHNKSGDPILCSHLGCYVSTGAHAPANFLAGRRAFTFPNTWGGRAGACSNRLGCVFRGIPVAQVPLELQPVDLHVLKHDRRETQAIETDSQCSIVGARLTCSRGIYAEDYAIWIVPEALADAAGPDVLQRAVLEGLNGMRSAEARPR